MNSLDKAVETHLKNIQAKTGKTLDELSKVAQASGLTKHSELRSMFVRDFGLGYGDANALAHALRKPNEDQAAAPEAAQNSALDEIYTGAKAALRPIHEQIMAAIDDFGDFEIAPKKGYLSLRRKKQFAMIGPATNARVEVGINMKGVPATERLTEMPLGGMCNYKVKVTSPNEVDEELITWLKQAYDSAG